MNGEVGNVLEEYYFDDYYRVLVINEDGRYVVSVDVYYANWEYSEHRELCIEEVCLLVKEIAPSQVKVSVDGVVKVLVIGTRVGGRYETINVKWIMVRKPSSSEISSIYMDSWNIAKGFSAASRKR
ncbi:MAG: hypothetical protein QXH02_06915 [Desulfurococcaceae archaeon]